MNNPAGREQAFELDRADLLAPLRSEYHIPRLADGTDSVYLCGHSLGLQPKATAGILTAELDSWAQRGVAGHFDSARPWLSYHEQLAAGLAQLTGAKPMEVVAMNSLSVNLHLMLVSFYNPTAERHQILIEKRAFPSDRYAVESQILQRGFDPADSLLEIAPRSGEATVTTEDVCEAIELHGKRIATVVLPGVQYLNGQRFDIATITDCAHRHGCIVGWDLAHAIGNTPLELHDWNADFAVWCSYKYLNAGPGAIGGCFVHERHAHATQLPRFAGWWGQQKSTRFAMPEDFTAIPGAEGWQISNPPVLAAAPLIASLDLFGKTTMAALRAKSIALTAYLESSLHLLAPQSITVLTPRDPDERGCQLSLRLQVEPARAREIHIELERRGFICDWREPDVIRAAPVPMYNTFTDVWRFATELAHQVKMATFT
ncbi:MAG: kynureninase [Steroidobacteraceae bacterium]